jgi:hypothetical protein
MIHGGQNRGFPLEEKEEDEYLTNKRGEYLRKERNADMAEKRTGPSSTIFTSKCGESNSKKDLKGHINLWLTKFCLFSDVAFPHLV